MAETLFGLEDSVSFEHEGKQVTGRIAFLPKATVEEFGMRHAHTVFIESGQLIVVKTKDLTLVRRYVPEKESP